MSWLSGISHRSTARREGFAAGQRNTIPEQGETGDALFVASLKRRLAVAQKNGWTVEDNLCFFCGKKAWRTGYLPEIKHAMAYCRAHEYLYHEWRSESTGPAYEAAKNRARLRTHMVAAGRLGGTFCGILPDDEKPKVSTNWREVDCQRCLAQR